MTYCVEDDLGDIMGAARFAGAVSPLQYTFGLNAPTLGGPVVGATKCIGGAEMQWTGLTWSMTGRRCGGTTAPSPAPTAIPVTTAPTTKTLLAEPLPPPSVMTVLSSPNVALGPSQPSPLATAPIAMPPASMDVALAPLPSPGAPMSMPSGGAATGVDGNLIPASVTTIPPAGGSSGMFWMLLAGAGLWAFTRRRKG